ncbi:MAG: NADPH-dependent 7-cyano-7-deazaguanine reductase QueF [Pseudomonadota bacterium]|nr:NADPH-dependent 7-cyano-7-deazaguanine reductase QueF [Pseudomonadota bacterium]
MDKGQFLGQQVDYPRQYDASILVPLPRVNEQDEVFQTKAAGVMQGQDLWVAYELSWLNTKGMPQVACAQIEVPSESSNMFESKSFKLYLNSFNWTQFDSAQAVCRQIEQDLSSCVKQPVRVKVIMPEEQEALMRAQPEGECLDQQDLAFDDSGYHYNPELLKAEPGETEDGGDVVYSHLLRSNCPVTNQPDWATIVIRYQGQKISKASLLRYIVSYRDHQGFHEQVVEQMFEDLWTRFALTSLTLSGQYTRRGGIDINPIRSSKPQKASPSLRLMFRQ